MLAKTIVTIALALSASALSVPHHGRSGHHHGIARRAPVAQPESQPVVPEVAVRPKRKRSLNKRCSPSNGTVSASATSVSDFNSSSSAFSASVATSVLTSLPVSPSYSAVPTSLIVSSDVPSDTSSWVAPSSSWVAPSSSWSDSSSWVASSSWVDTTTSWAQPTTSTYVAPTTSWSDPTTSDTWSSSAPAATSSASSGSGPSWLYGTQTGDGTYYEAGLGACGITNTDTDYIVAVSEDLFDAYPGYDGVNPNDNPVCNKQITASYEGKSVTVTVTDRCTGCSTTSIDFTPTAFEQLADLSVGRITGMTWVWV